MTIHIRVITPYDQFQKPWLFQNPDEFPPSVKRLTTLVLISFFLVTPPKIIHFRLPLCSPVQRPQLVHAGDRDYTESPLCHLLLLHTLHSSLFSAATSGMYTIWSDLISCSSEAHFWQSSTAHVLKTHSTYKSFQTPDHHSRVRVSVGWCYELGRAQSYRKSLHVGTQSFPFTGAKRMKPAPAWERPCAQQPQVA